MSIRNQPEFIKQIQHASNLAQSSIYFEWGHAANPNRRERYIALADSIRATMYSLDERCQQDQDTAEYYQSVGNSRAVASNSRNPAEFARGLPARARSLYDSLQTGGGWFDEIHAVARLAAGNRHR